MNIQPDNCHPSSLGLIWFRLMQLLPSVNRPSETLRLFPLDLLNRLTFDLELWHVCGPSGD